MLFIRLSHPREGDRVIDVVPGRVTVTAGAAAANPVRPGAGAHERPFVDSKAVRLVFGQVFVVVRMLLQDRRCLCPLLLGHLQPG